MYTSLWEDQSNCEYKSKEKRSPEVWQYYAKKCKIFFYLFFFIYIILINKKKVKIFITLKSRNNFSNICILKEGKFFRENIACNREIWFSILKLKTSKFCRNHINYLRIYLWTRKEKNLFLLMTQCSVLNLKYFFLCIQYVKRNKV